LSRQYWEEAILVSKVDGPSLSNSSSATSIIVAADKIIFPAGFFCVGRAIRIRGMGRLSNIVTTPGTLTIDVKLGSVVVWTSGAMQLSTTAHTTLPFVFSIDLVARAEGTSTNANMIGIGEFHGQQFNISSSDPTTGHPALVAPNSTPAVGTGYDSSATQQLDIVATFSVANSGNLLQLHMLSVEALH